MQWHGTETDQLGENAGQHNSVLSDAPTCLQSCGHFAQLSPVSQTPSPQYGDCCNGDAEMPAVRWVLASRAADMPGSTGGVLTPSASAFCEDVQRCC